MTHRGVLRNFRYSPLPGVLALSLILYACLEPKERTLNIVFGNFDYRYNHIELLIDHKSTGVRLDNAKACGVNQWCKQVKLTRNSGVEYQLSVQGLDRLGNEFESNSIAIIW